MSKTVDERVVSMSFDNSNFDKNVQKSINSIEELKSNLKFDKTQDAFSKINDSAKKVNLSGIEASLDRIKERFSTTGIVGMTVISNLTTSAMNMAKKTTKWFTKGVVEGGLRRAKNIEQAKFQLRGLKVEWDAIQADINYAVDGTAYGLDAAAKAASQLVASGVKFGKQSDDMKTALRAISGVAAMTNSTYEDTARIFTTVAGNGRLMGDQLNQLASRGLNVAASLAKARGITEKELRDLVSKGKVSFQEFAEIMDKNYGEHAAEANATFEGALSNTKAALSRIGADFVSPFIKDNGPLVSFFNRLRSIIDNIRKALIPLENEFMKPVMDGLNKVNKWMVNLDHATGSTYRRFTKMLSISDKTGKSVDKFNEMVKKTLKDNGVDIDALVDKYGDLGSAIDSLTGPKRSKALYDSFVKVGKVLDKDSKNSVVYHISKFDKVLGEVTKKYGPITKNNKKAIKALEKEGYSYSKLKDRITEFGTQGFTTFENYSKAQLKNIGSTHNQIILYREMVAAAKKAGLSIEDYVRNLESMESHGTGGVLILKTLKNAFDVLVQPLLAIKSAFFDVFGIKNNETDIYNVIYAIEDLTRRFKMTDQALSDLQDTFAGVFTIFKLILKVVAGSLRNALVILSNLLHLTGNNLLSVTAKIGRFIVRLDRNFKITTKNLTKLITKTKAYSKVQKALNNIFIPYGKSLKAHLIDNNLLGATYEYLSNRLKALGIMLKTFASEMINFSAFGNVFNSMKQYVTDLIGLFKRLFPSLSEGLDTISNIFSKDMLSASDIEAMVDVIKNTMVPELMDAGKWKTIGKFIGEGLRIGFLDSADIIMKTTRNFVEAFVNLIKGLLGIHSPSTVMEEIGENTMQGLIEGLRNVFGDMIDAIEYIVKAIVSTFSSIDFNKVIALGATIFVVKTIKDVVDALGTLTKPLENVSKMISAVKDTFKALTATIQSFHKLAVLFIVALGLTALAFSLYLLSEVPWQHLAVGIVAIAALAGIMLGLTAAMSKMKDVKLDATVQGLSVFIIAMASLVLIMAGAIFVLGKMDKHELEKGLFSVTVLVGIISFLIWSSKSWAGSEHPILAATGIAIMISSFTALLYSVAMAISAMKNVDETTLKYTIGIIGTLGGVIVAILLFNRKGGKLVGNRLSMTDIAATIFAIGVSIKLISMAIKDIAELEQDDVDRALGTILTLLSFIGTIIAFSAVLNKSKSITMKLDSTLVGYAQLFAGIAAAFMGIALSIKIISGIPDTEVENAINVFRNIAVFIGLFMGITLLATRGKSTEVKGFAQLFAGIGVAFLGIATAIKIIAYIPKDQLDNAVSAIILIGVMLMALGFVSSIYKHEGGKDSFLVFAGISLAIITIAAALVILSFVKWTSLLKGVIALGVVMLALAQVIKAAEKLSQTKEGLKTMRAITAALVTLVAGLIILALLDPSRVIVATAAISVVMAMLIKVMTAAKMLEKDIHVLVALTVMIAVLSGALIGLANLPIQNVLAATVALFGTLIGLSVLINASSKIIDSSLKSIIKMTFVFALLTAALMLIMYAVQKLDIKANISVFVSLGAMLLMMSLCMLIMVPVGAAAPEAVAGVNALMVFLVELIALIAVLGAVSESFPAIKRFIHSGFDLLSELSEGLGRIIGSFIHGIMGDSKGSKAASSMSQFFKDLKPLFKTLSTMDGDTVGTAKNLADTLSTLMKMQVPAQMPDFDVISENFAQLGNAMMSFQEVTGSLDTKDVNKISKVSTSLNSLVDMANSIPKTDGLGQVLSGYRDLNKFGEDIGAVADSVNVISEKAKNINSDDLEKIGNIGLATQELAKIEPAKVGGLISYFTGKVDLSGFGAQLGNLASGVSDFASNIQDVDVTTVQNGAESTKELVNVCNSIDIEKKDFAAFIEQIGSLGKSLSDFSSNEINSEVVNAAANSLDTLTTSLTNMAALTGTEAAAFQQNINTLIQTSLKEAVASINESKGKITKAINGLFTGSNDDSTSNVDLSKKFTKSLENSLKVFDSYKSRFNTAGNSLASAFSTGFNNSKVSLGSGITKSINKAVSEVRSYVKTMNTAGAGISTAFSKGFTSSKSNVNQTMKKTLQSCKKVIDDYKSKFRESGGHLAEGFAKGIALKSYLAETKAKAMAKAAKKAADKALKTASPSREMMKSGKWFVLGFSKGIEKNMEAATSSSALMSTRSMSSVVSAVGTINDTINNGIDPEPRIAPVMDTTTLNHDMNSAMSSINSGYAYDLGANVNVSNHGIDDIASAIATKVKDAIIEAMDRDDDVTININSVLECSGEAIARSSAQYMAPELNKIMTRANRRSGQV